MGTDCLAPCVQTPRHRPRKQRTIRDFRSSKEVPEMQRGGSSLKEIVVFSPRPRRLEGPWAHCSRRSGPQRKMQEQVWSVVTLFGRSLSPKDSNCFPAAVLVFLLPSLLIGIKECKGCPRKKWTGLLVYSSCTREAIIKWPSSAESS